MNCPPDLVLKIPTKRGNRFVWGRWRWRWCELYMVIISDERRYRALNTRPRLPSDPPLWTQNPIMRRESWQPSWSYCASNAGSRQGAAQDNLTLSSPLLSSPRLLTKMCPLWKARWGRAQLWRRERGGREGEGRLGLSVIRSSQWCCSGATRNSNILNTHSGGFATVKHV